MTPFDFVKHIQHDKKDLFQDPQADKDYVPFVVNRALSYDMDCILQSNIMNQFPHLDHRMQFHYLMGSIRGLRRKFQKWVKPETNEDLQAVKTLFECSSSKAAEFLTVLTPEQLKLVKDTIDVGGIRKSKKS